MRYGAAFVASGRCTSHRELTRFHRVKAPHFVEFMESCCKKAARPKNGRAARSRLLHAACESSRRKGKSASGPWSIFSNFDEDCNEGKPDALWANRGGFFLAEVGGPYGGIPRKTLS